MNEPGLLVIFPVSQGKVEIRRVVGRFAKLEDIKKQVENIAHRRRAYKNAIVFYRYNKLEAAYVFAYVDGNLYDIGYFSRSGLRQMFEAAARFAQVDSTLTQFIENRYKIYSKEYEFAGQYGAEKRRVAITGYLAALEEILDFLGEEIPNTSKDDKIDMRKVE